MKTHENALFEPDDEFDSEWETYEITHEKTSCLGTNDEIQLYFEFSARSAIYDGVDVCFNNKKYRRDEGDNEANYNYLDTPYTVFKNCYNQKYTDKKLETEMCPYVGV